MGDGGGVKQFVGEVGEAAREVVKDTGGGLKDMGQIAAESLTGVSQNPQQQQQSQQKRLEDQRKVQRTRVWLADLQRSQQKFIEGEKQKLLQRQQQEQQERQRKIPQEQARQKVIISPAKKTPQSPGQVPIREDIARARQEIGKGHGVGG